MNTEACQCHSVLVVPIWPGLYHVIPKEDIAVASRRLLDGEREAPEIGDPFFIEGEAFFKHAYLREQIAVTDKNVGVGLQSVDVLSA